MPDIIQSLEMIIDDKRRPFESNIIREAIRQLTPAKPRILALEEIPKYDGAFLIEYRHEIWPMQWTLFRKNLTDSYRFIRADNEIGFSINKASYGRTWRCWTSRPTDEQRKVVAWDA